MRTYTQSTWFSNYFGVTKKKSLLKMLNFFSTVSAMDYGNGLALFSFVNFLFSFSNLTPSYLLSILIHNTIVYKLFSSVSKLA